MTVPHSQLNPSAEERSFAKRFGYDVLRVIARLFGTAFFGVRCLGRQHIPKTGPALICSNHQSFLDPMLVGLAFDRRLNYLARKTLFRFPPFRWLIEYLDAIPVDQEGSGLAGLRESLRRLRKDEFVLIFPEGSRTPTGEIGPMMPGVCIIVRRAKVPIVPVGVDGAFQAWPIHQKFPKLHKLCTVIGKPITPAEIESYDDKQLLAELDRRIRECHETAAKIVRA